MVSWPCRHRRAFLVMLERAPPHDAGVESGRLTVRNGLLEELSGARPVFGVTTLVQRLGEIRPCDRQHRNIAEPAILQHRGFECRHGTVEVAERPAGEPERPCGGAKAHDRQ